MPLDEFVRTASWWGYRQVRFAAFSIAVRILWRAAGIGWLPARNGLPCEAWLAPFEWSLKWSNKMAPAWN